DAPVDAGLRGDETLRLGPECRVEIMHLPGHTPGHLGIWDPRSEAAIIIDAVLERGIYDREANLLIPPRYFDAALYGGTIRRLLSMRPEHLLTAHYPPMQGREALNFLDRSLRFVRDVDREVRQGVSEGVTDLWELTKRVDAKVGPYPESMVEFGASVRAHMATL
ncbi:MAG: hypothetical protein AB1425_06075, partial [Actinomycetota bacterium]